LLILLFIVLVSRFRNDRYMNAVSTFYFTYLPIYSFFKYIVRLLEYICCSSE